jgi:hypothetical protein
MKYFPEIVTWKAADKMIGISALKLESILQAELILRDSQYQGSKISALNKMDPGLLQNSRLAFIQSLGALDRSLSLELVMTAHPSLVHPAESKLEIVLFICGQGLSDAEVKEKIVSAFLNINPLLGTFFPEADFRPISSIDCLAKNRQYAQFKCAVAVDRQFKDIFLDSLFEHNPIGFGASIDPDVRKSENLVIRNLFQWIPSFSGWSQLIRLRPATLKKPVLDNLKRTISECDQFLSSTGQGKATLRDQAKTIKVKTLSRIDRLTQGCFNVGVFLLTCSESNRFLAKILGNAITGSGDNIRDKSSLDGGFRITEISLDQAVDISFFSDPDQPFTEMETSCAFRLPSPPFEEIPPGFPVKKFRTALAMFKQKIRNNDSIHIADNNHKGMERPVKIDRETRMRHCFILGQTGTGKSTLMENMIVQDIHSGRGVAVIDPHGDMIDQILGRIPKDRVHDVIFFNPLDTDRPIGFNVLEWKTIQERDLIIDDLYQIFHQAYDFQKTGGPMFELYFRGALSLLMGDKKRQGFYPTVLDFVRFFLDEGFRNYLKNSVDDVHLHDFFDQAEM